MNILKISKQIFKQNINKNWTLEQTQDYINKKIFEDEIMPNDIYDIKKFMDNQQIINLTQQQIPEKITTVINEIKKLTDNVECFLIVKSEQEDRFVIEFLLANGGNGQYGKHETLFALNQIEKILIYLDKKNQDGFNIYPSIRSYQGDIIDSIYYWVIQFWI